MTGFQDTPQSAGARGDPASKSTPLSRRHLLAAMGSAATYLGLLPLARVEENDLSSASGLFQGCSPAPVPIPGGFNARKAFGPRFPNRFFHLFLPGPGAEPSTIFDFRGKVGILNIHGTGTRTELDPDTGVPIGQTPDLPFATDVRFMQGTYVGLDGAEHQGTFAFFWMDVFQKGHQFGDFDFQLNDHNPGVSENGLFWTMSIPMDSVSLNLSEGKAAFCLSQALMPDLHDLLTALWGGGAVDGVGKPLGPVFSSTVSLQAEWFDAGPIVQTRDAVNRFVYTNAQTNARIKWNAMRREVRFENDDGPQQVLFAAIGSERNGSFF